MAREIAIFGAGGFVGLWLQKELRERKIPGLTIWPTAPGDFIDITDAAAVRDFVAGRRPSAVVNLAAISVPQEAEQAPDLAWAVNFMGTMNLARAIRDLSPRTRLIHVGSAEEYGSSFDERSVPVDEEAPLKPTGTYGATKAAADILVGQMGHDGLRAVRFRPFNHTGPGQTASFVAAAFARQIARIAAGLQEPVIEVGNLAPVRDFVDVRDVVRAYADAAIMESGSSEGEVFNLSSGAGVRIEEMLHMLIAASGASIAVKVDPARSRLGEVAHAVGDPAKARRVLGWQPRIPFAQTLGDVFADWGERVRRE